MQFKLRYTAIETRSLDRSIKFYTSIMGMKLIDRTKAPETQGEFATLKSDNSDHCLEINWYAGHTWASGDELDHIAFQVADLDTALAELKQMGVEPVSFTRETPRSRWTYISDPDGIWIELFQTKD